MEKRLAATFFTDNFLITVIPIYLDNNFIAYVFLFYLFYNIVSKLLYTGGFKVNNSIKTHDFALKIYIECMQANDVLMCRNNLGNRVLHCSYSFIFGVGGINSNYQRDFELLVNCRLHVFCDSV